MSRDDPDDDQLQLAVYKLFFDWQQVEHKIQDDDAYLSRMPTTKPISE
jgi:hypothetical protein